MGIPSDINTGLIYRELLMQSDLLREILAELRFANDRDADIEEAKPVSATAQGKSHERQGLTDAGASRGMLNRREKAP